MSSRFENINAYVLLFSFPFLVCLSCLPDTHPPLPPFLLSLSLFLMPFFFLVRIRAPIPPPLSFYGNKMKKSSLLILSLSQPPKRPPPPPTLSRVSPLFS